MNQSNYWATKKKTKKKRRTIAIEKNAVQSTIKQNHFHSINDVGKLNEQNSVRVQINFVSHQTSSLLIAR